MDPQTPYTVVLTPQGSDKIYVEHILGREKLGAYLDKHQSSQFVVFSGKIEPLVVKRIVAKYDVEFEQ